MKPSQDPFEAAFVEQDETPPESPTANDIETQVAAVPVNDVNQPEDEVGMDLVTESNVASTSGAPLASAMTAQPNNKNKDEEEEEEEENMDVELGKLQATTGDPDKMAKMQYVIFSASKLTSCMFYTSFSISFTTPLFPEFAT